MPVAHRGADGAGTEKENSLKAFKAAYDKGIKWLETDVVTTSDGVLLAIHGRGFQLSPNVDLPYRFSIQKMTYSQAVKSINIGGEPVLRLETLLDKFPSAKIFIDPKTIKTAPVLADFLAKRTDKDLSRLCIGSFNKSKIRLIKNKLSGSKRPQLCYAVIGINNAWPLLFLSRYKKLSSLTSWYKKWLGASTLYLPYKYLIGKNGSNIITNAHKHNMKIATYTVNNPVVFKKICRSNVDAIMSDKLDLLEQLVV